MGQKGDDRLPDSTLTPVSLDEGTRQEELFLVVVDAMDAALKDINPALEHPFYSLSKQPDRQIRRYEHNGNYLEIQPSAKGAATIYDKDILIYCISHIVAALKRGDETGKRVRINSHELLTFIGRGTSGRDYQALCDAVDRLSGTRIITNIRTGGEEQRDGFGLIDASSIRRKEGLRGRLLWMEIELSDWMFNAIRYHEVLTLHPHYFRLRKPLYKRLYELARKHCGHQDAWVCNIKLLQKKSGAKSGLKQFRYQVKEIIKGNILPDYRLEYVEGEDQVRFINREAARPQGDERWSGPISPDTFERLKAKYPNCDIYEYEDMFRRWLITKAIEPDSPDALFHAFVRRVEERNREAGGVGAT